MTTTLSTIGYEGARLDEFVETLLLARVEQVIDIRDVPVSRRPGFSKNVLARALEAEGISYVHLKPLGDPKPGREAARDGRFDDFVMIYNEHMSLPAAQEALRVAADAAKSRPSVLLCYERDYKHCHRTLVADAMCGLSSFEVRNLGVRKLPRPVSTRGQDGESAGGAISIA